MNQIKCPHCGQAFTVDESGFADILAQVRTQEFEAEIHTTLEKEKTLLAAQADATVSDFKNKLACIDGDITLAGVRDMTGSSRKYVLPLLEYFDSRGITRRIEDKRIFLKKQR